MQVILGNSAWSLQPEASGTAAPSAAPDGGAAPRSGMGGFVEMLWPMLLMMGIFYFLLLRPQQKRQREADNMLKSLRKGDKVRTSGGIRGEIVELTESDVWLQIADKVKINVLRSHIASRVEKTTAETKPETKPEESKPAAG